MRSFIKTLIVFIYFFLALFIQPSSAIACEYLTSNTSQPYIVSSSRHETTLINNKKEEYFVISKNNNRSEITNPSNKNDYYGYGSFDNANPDFNLTNDFIKDNATFPTCISHNISPNLKNAIYTRAP